MVLTDLRQTLITSRNSIENALSSVDNKALLGTIDKERDCVICMDVMDEEQGNLFTIPKCKHTFHLSCIAEWKKQSKKCPCCRGMLPEEAGPTLSVLQNIPAEQLNPELTRCEMLENLIFCAVWLSYPVCIVSSFLAVEVTSLGIFIVFIVPFFFLVSYTYFVEREFRNAFCLVIALGLSSPLVIGLVLTALVVQIFYMFYRMLKFYGMVLMCRIRWNYGASFIIGRTITLGSYFFNSLE
jgi:hypothetical protein